MNKKFFTAVLTAVMSLQSLCLSDLSAGADSAFLYRDLNDDGVFNVADIVRLQQYLSRKLIIEEKQLTRADINGDSNVDVFDLVLLKRDLLHTFENTRPNEWYDGFLENVKNQWYQDNNNVFFCSEEGVSMPFDPYVPNSGTYDRSTLLLALMYKYPDGQFAVQLDSWCDDDSQETREEERKYLSENGIEYTIVKEGVCETKYAVLNAAKLENFPVYEKAGYLIGLAKKTDIFE